MKDELQEAIGGIVADLFGVGQTVELTRPEEQFGDFATNIALQLAGKLGKNPREIAEQLAGEIQTKLSDKVESVSIAGPGFVNIKVADPYLLSNIEQPITQTFEGQTVVAEYSDPNPFKVLHAGHLYTTIVGDSVARLLEAAGARVVRLNYGGDVGLHVGKCLWGILQQLDGENPQKLDEIPKNNRLEWLSECYVAGNDIDRKSVV